jgi:hypothetical protein
VIVVQFARSVELPSEYLIKQTSSNHVCTAIGRFTREYIFQPIHSAPSSPTQSEKVGGLNRNARSRAALRESFAHCWVRQAMCNPAGAHGGKSALYLPGHFQVRQFSQQSIFLWQSRTTLGVVARDAQLPTMHFDRAGRMTGAGGYFRIRNFAQKCQLCFCPRLPDRVARWKSQLMPVKPNRGNLTTDEPRQILVRHGADLSWVDNAASWLICQYAVTTVFIPLASLATFKRPKRIYLLRRKTWRHIAQVKVLTVYKEERKPGLVPQNPASFPLNNVAKSGFSEEKTASLLHIGCKRRDQRTK